MRTEPRSIVNGHALFVPLPVGMCPGEQRGGERVGDIGGGDDHLSGPTALHFCAGALYVEEPAKRFAETTEDVIVEGHLLPRR
jgi:hypothetical protein